MRLDPAARAGPAFVIPDRDQLERERRRQELEVPDLSGDLVAVAIVEDRVIGGVPVRVYVPHGPVPASGRGVVAWLHGGGWVFGSLGTADAGCRRIAHHGDVVVVSVDYRLSPEARWPAAVDDGEAVVGALGRGEGVVGLGVDPSTIVVAGDSAGGFLAAVVARRARDRGSDLAGQVLVYPVIHQAGLHALPPDRGAGAGLSVAEMQWYWEQFLGHRDPGDDLVARAGAGEVHADVDPLAARLAGLPPALVLTAEHDILRAEGEAYAQALMDADVEVVLVRWQGLPHGFFRRITTYPGAVPAIHQVADWCRTATRRS